MNSKRYPADVIRDSAQRHDPPDLCGLPELLDACITVKDNTFPQLLLLMRFPQVHCHSLATARRRYSLDLYCYKV